MSERQENTRFTDPRPCRRCTDTDRFSDGNYDSVCATCGLTRRDPDRIRTARESVTS